MPAENNVTGMREIFNSKAKEGETTLETVERRQIPVRVIQVTTESLEGKGSKNSNRLKAKAREARIDRIVRILQVADNVCGR